jgi:hypothetical protein
MLSPDMLLLRSPRAPESKALFILVWVTSLPDARRDGIRYVVVWTWDSAITKAQRFSERKNTVAKIPTTYRTSLTRNGKWKTGSFFGPSVRMLEPLHKEEKNKYSFQRREDEENEGFGSIDRFCGHRQEKTK